MTVVKGDIIYAIDENKELEVDGLWGEASKIIDFSAIYTDTNMVNYKGEKIFSDRGFKFEEEGIVWKKISV